MKNLMRALALITLLVWNTGYVEAQVVEDNVTNNRITFDTTGKTIIGGDEYYILAKKIDSVIIGFEIVAGEIKAADPQKPVDWFLIIAKLLSAGVITSFITQLTKVWSATKNIVKRMPRGEWSVALVSILVGAGWMYLDTKFIEFSVFDLFRYSAQVFMVAIIAWRSFLSKIFIKPEAANTDQIEAAVERVIERRGLVSPPPSNL